MLQDFRVGLRRVLRARSFSLCVIVILGAGIGSTAAIFSVLNALVYRPISVPDPESLVAVTSQDARGARITPLKAIERLREANLPADGWCAYNSAIEATTSGGRLLDAYGAVMAGDCLRVIGITPAIGRWFTSDDAPLTGAGRPVIVITHRYWQRMFDGNADVLGKTVRIQNTDVQVIGVMPAGFVGLSPDYETDFVIPFNAHRQASGGVFYIGRLRNGVSIDQLRAQVKALWPAVLEAVLPPGPTRAQLLADLSGGVEPFGGGTSVLRRLYAAPVRSMAILSAGLILLVCVNVGGLLLARVAGRMHEVATQRALGASSSRIARPLLVEGAVLAVGGAAIGLPIAYAGSTGFASLLPWANLPWSIAFTPDATVFSGIAIGMLVLALAISSLPAWLATRHTSLVRNGRTASRASGRWARGLVVSQVAMTLVLVFMCGLIVRSVGALSSADLGFRNQQLLSIRLIPNPGGYAGFDQPAYYPGLVERLSALPGVESVGFARYFGTISSEFPLQPVGFAENSDAGASGIVEYISPRFFATAGIPVLSGRDVTWTDLPSTPRVAVVSESLARALTPDGNVVGRVIRYGTDAATAKLQIVGVVGDVSLGNFRQAKVPIVYTPGIQAGQATFATVHLKTAGDPLSLSRAASEVVSGLGREHVQRAMRVSDMFVNSMIAERMGAVATGIAAVLGLAISCIGLFALLSHAVERRTREIGIRVAVGASPAAVSGLVIRDALVLVVLGLVAGIPIAIAATSLVRSLLYGVTTTDTLTIAGSAGLLLLTGVMATMHPMVRAMRVDPSTALRAE